MSALVFIFTSRYVYVDVWDYQGRQASAASKVEDIVSRRRESIVEHLNYKNIIIIMWRGWAVSIVLPTRMPTARKNAGDFKIVTESIVFLYSFFFLVGKFVFRSQLINTTDSNNRYQSNRYLTLGPYMGQIGRLILRWELPIGVIVTSRLVGGISRRSFLRLSFLVVQKFKKD